MIRTEAEVTAMLNRVYSQLDKFDDEVLDGIRDALAFVLGHDEGAVTQYFDEG